MRPRKFEQYEPVYAQPRPQQLPAEKLAYTVPEVAERISLGTTTIRQLIHGGKLGCVRVGRALVIPKTCVEEFLAREAKVKTG
jgi:excisionase family DNA binding protein